jgi:uncharacterized protein (DUF2147 family)
MRSHGELPARAARLLVAAAALTIGVFSMSAGAQTRHADVTGTWIDHTGQGAVEILPCGDRMCGRVVWLKNPNHKSKSGRPICGTQILGDLKRRPNNVWESGWIFNPEDEERFSAEIKLKNENTLLVTGYLGFKWLGETYTWTRAPADIGRCTTKQAS